MKFLAITKKTHYAKVLKTFDKGEEFECEKIYNYKTVTKTSYSHVIKVYTLGMWTQEYFDEYFYSQKETRKMKLEKLKTL